MKTIFFVVNKNWEVEPVLNALTQKEFRPKGLDYPKLLNSPLPDAYRGAQPRAVFELSDGQSGVVQAVVWCVRDLMDIAKSESSSKEKYRVLPDIYRQYPQVDLVVAVGTAASTTLDRSIGGSVLVGGQFFLHDSRAADASNTEPLDLAAYGQVFDGRAAKALFQLLAAYCQAANVAAQLLPLVNLSSPEPDLPAPGLPQVFVSSSYISLGTVNIIDYKTYNVADKATHDRFLTLGLDASRPAVSVETTHGLIYLTAPANVPVLFVSGIANRLFHYGSEATAAHRYQAAFNMGTVVGNMLLALAANPAAWDVLPVATHK